MGNLRKVIASISLVAILSTFAVTNAAFAKSPFTDVGDKHWFTTEGWDVKAKDAGIFTKTTAMPDASVIRADMAMMVAAAAGLDMTNLEAFPSGVFTDVKSTDYWYKALQAGRQANVFSEKPKFDAVGVTNRAQAAKVIVSAFGLTPATPKTKTMTDVNLSYTGADAWMNNIYTAYCYGLVKAGTFNPGANVTRAEFAKMLVVAKDAPTLKAECTKGTDVVPPVKTGGGTVSFSVVNDPTYTTLPKYATSVALMSFDVDGGTNGVTLKSFDLHKTGVSTLPSDFQVYVYEDGTRLTSGKSFNSTSDVAAFTNLGLTVAAGKTRTFTIKADVGTTANTGSFAVEIKDGAVTTDADSVDGLPLESKTYDLSLTPVGTVTISKNGTVNDPKVGEQGAQISKFKIAADTEGASLEQLGLFVGGSINVDEVKNFKLYVTGVTDPVATADGVGSKNIATFVFAEPYAIEKGGTKSFYVTADFVPGRSSDTVKTFIDEKTDVVAVGDKYNFGMKVTDSAYNGTESACTGSGVATCNYALLTGGDITLSSNGPVAQDIAVNSKDVRLMDFTMNSVADVTVKQLAVTLDASESAAASGLLNGTTANFTDIKIINVDTGEVLMGPVDATSFLDGIAGSAIAESGTDDLQSFYVYTDEFSMTAGQTLHLALTSDIANQSALSGDTVVASVYINSSYPQFKDVNNKTVTNSASVVPYAEITGKTMTVKAASLTMTKASIPGIKTYVKGTKDIKFTGISFACGTASDCKITDLTVSAHTNGVENVNSDVSKVKFVDADGKAVSVEKSVGTGTTGTVQFTNLNWTIKAGATPTYYLVGELSSNATTSSHVAFGIATTSAVTAEDKDGNSITGDAVSGTPNSDYATYAVVSAGGSLVVAVDAATPHEDLLVAGTSNVTVAKYRLTSTDESFTVRKLDVTNASPSAGTNDNDVTGVKITYTDSTGAVKTTSPVSVSNGNASFSGLDMYVAADDTATFTLSADLNTIQGGATSGEFTYLVPSFANLDVLANGSNQVYKVQNVGGAITIGTTSFIDTGKTVSGTVAVTAGSSATIVLSAAMSTNYPVGTFFKDNSTGATMALTTAYTGGTSLVGTVVSGTSFTNTNAVYVSQAGIGAPSFADSSTTVSGTVAVTAGSSATVVLSAALASSYPVGTLFKDNSTGATLALTRAYTGGTSLVGTVVSGTSFTNTNAVYVASNTASAGFLTTANRQNIAETKPTLAIGAGNPTGTKSVSSSADTIFKFDVTADPKEKVVVRAGLGEAAVADGFDGAGSNNAAPAANTSISVDGSSTAQALTGFATNDSVSFDLTTAYANYSNIGFWVYQASGGTEAQFADFAYGFQTTATATAASYTAASASMCNSSSGTLVMNTWYYCTATATPSARYLHIRIAGITTRLATTDTLYFDQVTAYNDKIRVNLSSDASLNSTSNALAATLHGGVSNVTGYISAYSTSSAFVDFIPTVDLETAKGQTTNYYVDTVTATLINDAAGTADLLTPSITYGSSAAGSVTAGGFWWYDTNAAAKWVGYQSSSSLQSTNSISY